MPMCARCAGMYTGFLIALVAFVVVGRRQRGAPRGAFVGLSCVAFAVFIGEGTAEFFGLWNGPGALRFAVGMLAGVFLAPYITVLFYDTVGQERDSPPVAGGRAAWGLLAVVAVLSAANIRPPRGLLVAESVTAAAGVISLLWVAHTAVLVLILDRRRRVAAGAVAVGTVAAQLALFSWLRSLTGM